MALNAIYKSFGRDITMTAHTEKFLSDGNTGADVVTYPSALTPPNSNIKNINCDPGITFYRASFNSFSDFSKTVLHEFGHVGRFLSEAYQTNYLEMYEIYGNRRFGNGNKSLAPGIAKAKEEMHAYKYAQRTGGINPNQYSGYINNRQFLINYGMYEE